MKHPELLFVLSPLLEHVGIFVRSVSFLWVTVALKSIQGLFKLITKISPMLIHCFISSDKVDDPFKARKKCYDEGGTYNLASIRSESIFNQLLAKMIELRFGETRFWIGLDDSIQQSHATTSFFSTAVPGDPDGLWYMDNGDAFPPAGTSVTWGPGHPSPDDTWGLIFFNGTSGSIQAMNSSAGVDSHYICERPKPCFACDRGWTFFNGHCYLSVLDDKTANEARGICDAHNAYLLTINTPIEQSFIERFVPDNQFKFFGLTRLRGGHGLFDEDYEWDDGTRISTSKFSHWMNNQPNDKVGYGTGWIQFLNRIEKDRTWQDIDYDRTYDFICEKDSYIPTIQCPNRKKCSNF